jgi:hypothetical protein
VCGNTGWLFILKLSSWRKAWTSLMAFINWEFITRCLLATIARTRTFIKFKMASVKRKTLLAQLFNCHNSKENNVHSILPCLRETNRISRHFVYISIDTTYNRFLHMTVFVKGWFITVFAANEHVSRVPLRLVWNC